MCLYLTDTEQKISWHDTVYMSVLQGRKWHQGSEAYGKVWQKGDVIGCMIDMTDKTISKLNSVFRLLYILYHFKCKCFFCILKEIYDKLFKITLVFSYYPARGHCMLCVLLGTTDSRLIHSRHCHRVAGILRPCMVRPLIGQ